jgi:hypothetical protein
MKVDGNELLMVPAYGKNAEVTGVEIRQEKQFE